MARHGGRALPGEYWLVLFIGVGMLGGAVIGLVWGFAVGLTLARFWGSVLAGMVGGLVVGLVRNTRH